MSGEIQLNSTTFATESGGTITVANVDSATNRQNLGLEIGVDVQAFDADTTKNDVANTFTANQTISVTDNTNAALSVTQLGTGNAFIVNDEGSETTPFVIDASGNVGIGISSPSFKLQVAGVTNVEVSSGDARYRWATGSKGGWLGTPSWNSDSTFLYSPTTTSTEQPILSYNGTVTDGFAFNTGSTPSERMRIDSDGTVLLNRTSTSSNTGGQFFTPDYAFIERSNGPALYLNRFTTNGSLVDFRSSNSTVGSISTNGTTTSYNTSSDYRLKENITEITDGITRVKQLNPSRFNFIIDRNTTVDGFIAHEVSDIVPEAVSGEKDAVDDDGNPEYQGIDQSKLVPLLTAALQESITIIESLQTTVADLTARIEALETT